MSLDKYLYLIEKSYTDSYAKKFTSSYLNNNLMDVLKQSCREVLQMLPPQPFECVSLSAALVEWTRQAGMSSYLVAGSLTFKGNSLFQYDPIVQHKSFVENWRGHCWVIVNDVIAEISLFRTMYSEKTASWPRSMIIENFGEQKGAIIATTSEMEEMGFSYTPEYIFNDLKLSAILNYIEHCLSRQNNIPIDTTTSRIVCPVPGFSNLEIAE